MQCINNTDQYITHFFIRIFFFELESIFLPFGPEWNILLKNTRVNFATDIKPKYPLIYTDHPQNDLNMTGNMFICPVGFIGKTVRADGYAHLLCEKCPSQTYLLTGGLINSTKSHTSPPFVFQPPACYPCDSRTTCFGGKQKF